MSKKIVDFIMEKPKKVCVLFLDSAFSPSNTYCFPDSQFIKKSSRGGSTQWHSKTVRNTKLFLKRNTKPIRTKYLNGSGRQDPLRAENPPSLFCCNIVVEFLRNLCSTLPKRMLETSVSIEK